MTDESDGGRTFTEREVREVVRDELRAATSTDRRSLIGTIGVVGLAGLAGCASGGRTPAANDTDPTESDTPRSTERDTPRPTEHETPVEGTAEPTTGPLDLRDDDSLLQENVQTLNLRRNLTADLDGAYASIDAERGLDVVGSGGDLTRVTRIDSGSGIDVSTDDDTATISNSRQIVGGGDYLAERGDVQSTLDDAFEDDVGRVELIGGGPYEFDSSIEIPPGIVLDCTRARIDMAADVNGFELHTQSRVLNPTVRTAHLEGYSSSIFHVHPAQFGEQFGTNRPVPTWTVSGGWSDMTPGEGTCIELHGVRENPGGEYDPPRDSKNVFFCFVSHNCVGGRRFAYLHREGGETTRGGHVNGNVIRGFATNTTRFIETDDTASGKNMVNGNKFNLVTQPYTESEWLWYANKGTRNELYEWGKNWDYGRYSDDDGDGYPESWYIGPNAGKNYVWRKEEDATGGLGSTVLDDSNGASNSRYLILDKLGVTVDELEIWDDAA